MQKFTSLHRKTLLNYSSGWQFILSIHRYPIILYINLHNINNFNLHQIKQYMVAINGCAQVLNTQQLIYLFGKNIKFKFMVTGNIVALTFETWQNVWNFNNFYKQQGLLISTISIKGVFLNLGVNSLDFLEDLYQQGYSKIVDINMKLNKINVSIYYYLSQYIFLLLNIMSTILFQLVQTIHILPRIINLKQNN